MQEFVTIPTYLIRELPADKFHALADFLSMTEENGEVPVSVRKLMKRWGWSNTKVTGFIKTISEKDVGKIEKRQEKDTVFLVNTDFLSGAKDKKKTEKRQKVINKKDSEQSEETEIYKRVIEYLNSRCGTRYTEKNKQTKESIHARLEEKFTEEDFYTVIDKKCNEWLGTEMERYLRPQTLFGTKFESYLNQNIVKEQKNGDRDILSEWRNS